MAQVLNFYHMDARALAAIHLARQGGESDYLPAHLDSVELLNALEEMDSALTDFGDILDDSTLVAAANRAVRRHPFKRIGGRK